MSYKSAARENKQQKHSKVHFTHYMFNINEPPNYAANDSPTGLDNELEGSVHKMRQEFRQFAKALRTTH